MLEYSLTDKHKPYRTDMIDGQTYRSIKRLDNPTGDPKVLNVTMAKLPRADQFRIREPHLIGEEIFGS
jgi:hypothetical protein